MKRINELMATLNEAANGKYTINRHYYKTSQEVIAIEYTLYIDGERVFKVSMEGDYFEFIPLIDIMDERFLEVLTKYYLAVISGPKEALRSQRVQCTSGGFPKKNLSIFPLEELQKRLEAILEAEAEVDDLKFAIPPIYKERKRGSHVREMPVQLEADHSEEVLEERYECEEEIPQYPEAETMFEIGDDIKLETGSDYDVDKYKLSYPSIILQPEKESKYKLANLIKTAFDEVNKKDDLVYVEYKLGTAFIDAFEKARRDYNKIASREITGDYVEPKTYYHRVGDYIERESKLTTNNQNLTPDPSPYINQKGLIDWNQSGYSGKVIYNPIETSNTAPLKEIPYVEMQLKEGEKIELNVIGKGVVRIKIVK